VQDSVTASVDRVPLLGDLPLLGALFRYDTRKQTKTNLMVFLRPLVMRDSTSYGGVTSERYRQLLGEQEKTQPPPHPVLPDFEGPRLPPIETPTPIEPPAPAAK
jgi:general secretion pathway protein D